LNREPQAHPRRASQLHCWRAGQDCSGDRRGPGAEQLAVRREAALTCPAGWDDDAAPDVSHSTDCQRAPLRPLARRTSDAAGRPRV